MAARRVYRSISTPITLGSVAVVLTIALLVGWTLVSLQNIAITRRVAENTALLVAGIVSLAIVLSVVVLFSVFLVREILEVRRQSTFIDSVTHELKSPLASLKLCLETLRRTELTESQREELRQMMLGDVERLSLFIDDILETSRLAHGRRSYVLSEVTLVDLVQRCADTVAKRYKLPASAIRVSVAPELRLVTDIPALETVLKNLLDNGVKYSDAPPEVSVAARPTAGGALVLEVTDGGIGIPPKHLKRIFERFYRVPAEEVYARKGTGLGLFVVSSLVRTLGGKLEAYSEGPRRGTRMRVELPLAAAPPSELHHV